jgi:hypothetical protein
MGNSRMSVLPGPVLTAARTFSTCVPPLDERRFAFSHAFAHAFLFATGMDAATAPPIFHPLRYYSK